MATVWKSCAFGQPYVIFVMSTSNFGCFPFWFGWQDLGSDCASSGYCLPLLACCQGSKPLLGPFSDTESYF